MPEPTPQAPGQPRAPRPPEEPQAPPTAQRPARQRPAEPGRDRLVRALLKPTRGQAVVAVLLALVGFAGVTQVRSNEVDDSFAGYREQDLIDVLSGLAGASQRAQSEITRLERTRDDLASDTSAEAAALAQARSEADTLSILAGTVPVTGPGVRITLSEVTGTVGAQALVAMVQDLRTADAEAMQLNGRVRLVAQSSFADATGGIVVDGELLEAPYVLDVIGAPATLSGAVDFFSGPRLQLEESGIEVEVTELTSLDIESVAESTQPEYAAPADGQ
ncbi:MULTISPECIES: DUF881 domain-containing protein [Nocardioides]|uniref:DUF881 domain-containing protein n=2 Tax=Nocardioidaceae TaxID=85015 RepID=UPI00187B0418|nr:MULTISPECIES: DUF881 domain-containing protein [Nocardioides]MBJ7528138.1 DUF881 domain-containing protein [Nocardioides sp.]MCM3515194.1 DUF881 domain-containing protein [Nocardioides sp. P86]